MNAVTRSGFVQQSIQDGRCAPLTSTLGIEETDEAS